MLGLVHHAGNAAYYSLGMVAAMTALSVIGAHVNRGTLVVALDEVYLEPLPCQSLHLFVPIQAKFTF